MRLKSKVIPITVTAARSENARRIRVLRARGFPFCFDWQCPRFIGR